MRRTLTAFGPGGRRSPAARSTETFTAFTLILPAFRPPLGRAYFSPSIPSACATPLVSNNARTSSSVPPYATFPSTSQVSCLEPLALSVQRSFGPGRQPL